MPHFVDFDLILDPDPNDPERVIITAQTLNATQQASFAFPYNGVMLETRLDKLEKLLSKGTRAFNLASAPNVPERERPVRELAVAMFESLLPGELRALYRQAHNYVHHQQLDGVRLRLRINTPQWNSLPWEFMYDPDSSCYVGVKSNTPIIRLPELRQPPPPLTVEGTLRILAMIANPDDPHLDRLNVERERERLQQAIHGTAIEVEWIAGTVDALANALTNGQRWHVFHYIGHGGFDERNGGLLAFENAEGKVYPYRAEHLKNRLTGHPSLRFAFLNCCMSGTTGKADVFSSTAATLIRGGLTGVLAMQFEVSDNGAIRFAEQLYQGLVKGQRLETTVTEARLRLSELESFEWGTPVLYLASPDGVLFTVQTTGQPTQNPIPAAVPAAPPPSSHPRLPDTESSGTAAEDPLRLFNEASACVEGERYSEATALYERLLGWAPPFRERQVRALLKQAEELLAEQEKARAAQKRLEEAEERFSDLETFVQLARTESAKAHAREEIQQFLADYPEYKTDANVLALWERVKPPPPPKPPEPALGTRMTDEKGVIMVYVPPGTFQMGSSNDADERPIHSVTIERGFWLDLTPVTNASYAQFITDGGYKTETYWTPGGWAWRKTADKTAPRDYDDFTAPQQPRVGVTWFEADAYCRWRGGRLPTEAEWEWAARGERSLVYPWGNDFKRDSSVVIYRENSGEKSHPVGEGIRVAGASWVGALDMSGNVWEWISSLYTPYPYDGNDGREADTGDRTDVLRVLRGGSWGDSQDNVRAANRFRVDPANQFNRWGFRLARSYR